MLTETVQECFDKYEREFPLVSAFFRSSLAVNPWEALSAAERRTAFFSEN
jgi:hypothetical protein